MMKREWLITFRTITFAQRAERILQEGGINTRLHRTPKSLSQRGCGYCLSLREADVPVAIELLHLRQLRYEKIYVSSANGWEEGVV
ncbi:MAG: DUF3343 domain-containing protein [Ruminococcaceae bacterium]|nr:DUF3343 domain-containing protein [Oscillospiraceae bacterium]